MFFTWKSRFENFQPDSFKPILSIRCEDRDDDLRLWMTVYEFVNLRNRFLLCVRLLVFNWNPLKQPRCLSAPGCRFDTVELFQFVESRLSTWTFPARSSRTSSTTRKTACNKFATESAWFVCVCFFPVCVLSLSLSSPKFGIPRLSCLSRFERCTLHAPLSRSSAFGSVCSGCCSGCWLLSHKLVYQSVCVFTAKLFIVN